MFIRKRRSNFSLVALALMAVLSGASTLVAQDATAPAITAAQETPDTAASVTTVVSRNPESMAFLPVVMAGEC